jgi:conjugal transfer pilus assembly protein TraV
MIVDKEFKQQTFSNSKKNCLESLVFPRQAYQEPLRPPLQALIFLTLAILLSACSTTSETFDCEPGKGVGCRSITTVNKMIDQGHFAYPPQGTAPLLSPVIASSSQAVSEALPQALSVSEEIVLTDKTVVQRSPEQHMRVWIAPFQDEGGNFHEGSLVHSVIQTGFWHVQGNPWGA